ncbi:hypothetical protein BDN72DRAFT_966256 [Pluteus cervinus]|uniref:Uncharacterized protein n=1 Tax=Pluteus cervinus TaxID=181527 RepID=A0ACD2ZZD8_9AGAR|nr:hypothetical protein BDN72DRAFT_966256 [Pluteus cervinus]
MPKKSYIGRTLDARAIFRPTPRVNHSTLSLVTVPSPIHLDIRPTTTEFMAGKKKKSQTDKTADPEPAEETGSKRTRQSAKKSRGDDKVTTPAKKAKNALDEKRKFVAGDIPVDGDDEAPAMKNPKNGDKNRAQKEKMPYKEHIEAPAAKGKAKATKDVDKSDSQKKKHKESESESSDDSGSKISSEGEDEEVDGKTYQNEKPKWAPNDSKKQEESESGSGSGSESGDSKDTAKAQGRGRKRGRESENHSSEDEEESVERKPRKARKFRSRKVEKAIWKDETDALDRGGKNKASRRRHHRPPSTDSSDSDSNNSISLVLKNDKPLAIKPQRSRVKDTITAGINQVIVDAVCELPGMFPEGVDDLDAQVRLALRHVAERKDWKDIVKKVNKDDEYARHLGAVLKDRIGKYRGEYRKHIDPLVQGYWSLSEKDDINKFVGRLLDQRNFVYEYDEQADKFCDDKEFQHPIIAIALRHLFEDGNAPGSRHLKALKKQMVESTKESNPDFDVDEHDFEIPAPMVAFAATMIEGRLMEWKAGTRTRITKPPTFDAARLVDVFKGHNRLLKDAKKKNAKKYHALMVGLLRTASEPDRYPKLKLEMEGTIS